MHILLDMQSCQSESRFRGIGRYSMSLAKAIIKNAYEHRVSILLNGLYPINITNSVKNEFKNIVVDEDIHIFSSCGPLAAQYPENRVRAEVAKITREVAIGNINPDIVCSMSFFEGFNDNLIVSVPEFNAEICNFTIAYDLIPLLNEDVYFSDHRFKEFYLKKIIELAFHDGVLAISSYAADEVKSHVDIAENKITNISSASNDIFKKILIDDYYVKEIRNKYNIDTDFIMTVGEAEARKNIEGLFGAYSLLSKELRTKNKILLACKINDFNKEYLINVAKKYGIKKSEIIFTGFVPDDDLVLLYNICSLFVFPSLHEGFGLPPLEAMCCGAVTITSNTSSLPEVMGWSESMFDPCDVNSIAQLMTRALTDEVFREQLIENAQYQSKLFSWDKSARIAIAAFEQGIADKRNNLTSNVTKNNIKTLAIKKIKNLFVNEMTNVDLLKTAWSLVRNEYSENQKMIYIDISVLIKHDAKTGIQRVVKGVLNNMPQKYNGYEVRPIYCEIGKTFNFANKYLNDNFGLDYGDDEPVLFSDGDILLGLDLAVHLFPYINVQLNSIRHVGVNVYYIVYDVIPLLHPEWCDENIQILFPKWIESLAKHSDGLICISNSVAKELDIWIKNNVSQDNINPYLKINYFHLGTDFGSDVSSLIILNNERDFLKKLNKDITFLMVGTIEPRKGHSQVISAFEILWNQGVECNLVIVGKKEIGTVALISRIELHPLLNKNLFWLGDVNDGYLKEMYSISDALIFASFAEGFGLPVIEAAKNGLPVILRDIPVLKEIAGDNAFYFSGEEPSNVSDAITEWIELKSRDAVPPSNNIKWMTWKESTLQLLEKIFAMKKLN